MPSYASFANGLAVFRKGLTGLKADFWRVLVYGLQLKWQGSLPGTRERLSREIIWTGITLTQLLDRKRRVMSAPERSNCQDGRCPDGKGQPCFERQVGEQGPRDQRIDAACRRVEGGGGPESDCRYSPSDSFFSKE
ncbi:uncharacterized protein MYCGRDRAFT_98038 [Zymoseptoria tritici IPO323]|uniref:Uncharacterized protein n=1 Tax=Zymoseptoria tritici (strain CBS 115943 / IPO323) TaxID=336722 RepID=F9XS49_ZYMTI|nr:uncharacterized protein MYCGRDRAFT_98038 [Zymoseptoria tritici IPO323]EGP81905.1 hypothetical protein MYCGRDRAFT_98038 [Zymoseptoria tritici IPO323]